jgi:hypothetical protein
MPTIDLLDTVQPTEGWYAILGIKGKSTIQELVATRKEADALVQKFLKQKRNVFFGVAKYKADAGRTKENVLSLKAFWVDIDCGEAKAAVNPKTGRPDGYVDQVTGIQALRQFCTTIGLPKPLLVSSGNGVHAYWPLTESVTREQWEPVGERLRDLCITHKFYIDPKVFEVARILRVPDTYNFKGDDPKPVGIISEAPAVEFEAFRDILGVKETAQPKPKRELTELAKSMQGNHEYSFKKIMLRSIENKGCQQLMNCYTHQEDISEPLWWDALSVANSCVDRDSAIHKLSNKHPNYDPAETESKAAHSGGPHTCKTFERSNPGGCDGCPYYGKINTPIVLGREVIEAEEKDNEVLVETEEEEDPVLLKIPKYPAPFFRGKGGGIYKQPVNDEEEAMRVYEHDFYVLKRMRDPVLGEVVVMRLHLPRDGMKEFVLPNSAITDKRELRRGLASYGVVTGTKAFNLLMEYILLSIKELQFVRKAEQMRLQFGWADNDSKFIIGDREITRDGIFHSPPSSTTADIAQWMHPKGSLDKWKEVFALYGREGCEPHAFGALAAFGAPLLKFFGQNGAIVNLIHEHSGTGKSTSLFMCNSVYGHPEKLCGSWADTLNAKIMMLGVMNNLPFTMDEMTNTTPADFSTLAYSMSQGRGKNRVKASANELRSNLTSWQTISLCSSNASFYEKLGVLKNNPEGEMMRLLEYKIDYLPTHVIPPTEAKALFDHQLKENYGLAGDVYIEWVVKNLEEAKNTALSIQAKIDRELKMTQRERFWSAVVAAHITGGLIAKNLQLIDWDMKAIYRWATDTIIGMRDDVKPPVNDVVSIVGDYINRHMQNILVVNDEADRRTQMPMMPTLEPRGELLVRYEPDTKKMFLAAKPFKDDCVKMQINYRNTLKKLEERGVYVGTANKRMSKGMKVVSPGVHCLIFDCSNDDFIDMDVVVTEAPTENAGGEG